MLDPVCAGAALRRSWVHGEQHWRAVAHAGLVLCRALPDADAEIVFLFALLHDSRRRNENRDSDHGPRAARLAGALADAGLVTLSRARLDLLKKACTLHDTGAVSNEPTVGACFDADRLNLWRVGTVPDVELLSTVPARDQRLIVEAAGFHDLALDWARLSADYARHALTS